MFKCTVEYGSDIEPLASDRPITVGQIRQNQHLKSVLGFGDNVNIMIAGVTMPDEAIVPIDSRVTIETAANTKATALAA